MVTDEICPQKIFGEWGFRIYRSVFVSTEGNLLRGKFFDFVERYITSVV